MIQGGQLDQCFHECESLSDIKLSSLTTLTRQQSLGPQLHPRQTPCSFFPETCALAWAVSEQVLCVKVKPTISLHLSYLLQLLLPFVSRSHFAKAPAWEWWGPYCCKKTQEIKKYQQYNVPSRLPITPIRSNSCLFVFITCLCNTCFKHYKLHNRCGTKTTSLHEITEITRKQWTVVRLWLQLQRQ